MAMKRLLLALVLSGAGTAAQADEMIGFQSPSGNIHCLFFETDGARWLRCDLAEGQQTYTTPPPECDLDWGMSFYIGETGKAGLSCHGDTVMDPADRVLPYGEEIAFDGIRCSSERTGITCRNAAGHGFSLARAKQHMF